MITKREAIEKHRELWNMIADKTEETNNFVTKRGSGYFDDYSEDDVPLNNCFCCEFDESLEHGSACNMCPLWWNDGNNCYEAEYEKWHGSESIEDRIAYARMIVELPEAEIVFRERKTGNEITLTELLRNHDETDVKMMLDYGEIDFERREKK